MTIQIFLNHIHTHGRAVMPMNDKFCASFKRFMLTILLLVFLLAITLGFSAGTKTLYIINDLDYTVTMYFTWLDYPFAPDVTTLSPGEQWETAINNDDAFSCGESDASRTERYIIAAEDEDGATTFYKRLSYAESKRLDFKIFLSAPNDAVHRHDYSRTTAP